MTMSATSLHDIPLTRLDGTAERLGEDGFQVAADRVVVAAHLQLAGLDLVQAALDLDIELSRIREWVGSQLGANQGRREESVDGLAVQGIRNPRRLLVAARGEPWAGVGSVELAEHIGRRLAVTDEKEAHPPSLRDEAEGQAVDRKSVRVGKG